MGWMEAVEPLEAAETAAEKEAAAGEARWGWVEEAKVAETEARGVPEASGKSPRRRCCPVPAPSRT